MSDRLSPLDASFLQIEDADSHMHVAAALVFEGEAPPYDEFVDHVDARLHLVPRYRQRAVGDPLGLGRPRWVDDERFDLRYHVRATGLPRPAGEEELKVLAGRVFGRQLRRDRPLWEMWLVDGLEGGRFAVLSKTHHALVDGISGLDILSVLFAPDEDDRSAPWHAEPGPGTVELLAGAVLERAGAPLGLVRGALGGVLHPERAVERVGEALGGVAAMAGAALSPAPRTPYNRPVRSPDRRFTWARASLEDVKAIKNELGGTVNDVLLTVVTRALRRHLERRGVDTDHMHLRAFVPVSVRAEAARGALGNQVSGMVVALPLGCRDPGECLRRIGAATRAVKDSGQAVGAQALTGLAGFAPPTLVDQASRLAVGQRFVNLVVTNVPGPQQPLELAGHQLLDIIPMVPVGKNLALGVAIVSYNGRVAVGLTGEFDALHDLDDLAEDVEWALAELLEAAVDTPTELAEPDAEEGAGAEVHVDPPWDGYDAMAARDVVDRLAGATDEALAVVALYEQTRRGRRTVIEAAERALAISRASGR